MKARQEPPPVRRTTLSEEGGSKGKKAKSLRKTGGGGAPVPQRRGSPESPPMAGRYMRVAHRLDRDSFVRRSVNWENVPIAVVARCVFSPLCSRCFTHEFGEFAVEP